MDNPLIYSGIANKSNFEAKQWKEIFLDMEKYQDYFLSHEKDFRSKEYTWPSDALHNWSRLWEYPYIFSNLLNLYPIPNNSIKILDVGSGVTFFSFYLASKGFNIHTTDIDPIAERDINKAVKFIDIQPGELNFTLCNEESLPFEDNCFDSVLSVSIIEHVYDIEKNIQEICRVLKPNGTLLLTFDIDLENQYELTPNTYMKFIETLKKYFEIKVPEKVDHPLNNLTNSNSLNPDIYYLNNFQSKIKTYKNSIKKILRIPYFVPGLLTCQGLVLVKKFKF